MTPPSSSRWAYASYARRKRNGGPTLMPILHCYVDDETLAILKRVAEETDRNPEDVAEAAIAEAALASQRARGWPPSPAS
jgi:hypothetical protein